MLVCWFPALSRCLNAGVPQGGQCRGGRAAPPCMKDAQLGLGALPAKGFLRFLGAAAHPLTQRALWAGWGRKATA